jgi:hypothetical protein
MTRVTSALSAGKNSSMAAAAVSEACPLWLHIPVLVVHDLLMISFPYLIREAQGYFTFSGFPCHSVVSLKVVLKSIPFFYIF